MAKISSLDFGVRATSGIDMPPLYRAGLRYAFAAALEYLRAGLLSVGQVDGKPSGADFVEKALAFADQHVSAPNDLIRFQGTSPLRSAVQERLRSLFDDCVEKGELL